MDQTELILSLVFAVGTQLIKNYFPEKVEEFKKHVVLSLVILGAIVNLLRLLASGPLDFSNVPATVLFIFTEVLYGGVAGLIASGTYEFAKNIPVLNTLFVSTTRILNERK